MKYTLKIKTGFIYGKHNESITVPHFSGCVAIALLYMRVCVRACACVFCITLTKCTKRRFIALANLVPKYQRSGPRCRAKCPPFG